MLEWERLVLATRFDPPFACAEKTKLQLVCYLIVLLFLGIITALPWYIFKVSKPLLNVITFEVLLLRERVQTAQRPVAVVTRWLHDVGLCVLDLRERVVDRNLTKTDLLDEDQSKDLLKSECLRD